MADSSVVTGQVQRRPGREDSFVKSTRDRGDDRAQGARSAQDAECSGPHCCGPSSRREFLQVVTFGAAASLSGDGGLAMAGPFDPSDFTQSIPADKKLRPEWVESLFARGGPTVHRGTALAQIGMPIGGICAGQLYLGGDGKLWHWDIFNRVERTNDAHYAHPLRPESPLEAGFAIRIKQTGHTEVRTLDRSGFSEVGFRGEYPLGFVTYLEPGCPVRVDLEAFSPFIPLSTLESSLPATVLIYRVTNTSGEPVDVEIGGWLENAVCLDTGRRGEGFRRNRVVRDRDALSIESWAEPAPADPHATVRPPIVLADFEGDSYGRWMVEGDAFGKRPSQGPRTIQQLRGFQGKGLVNSWTGTDALQGRLLSAEFTIERAYLNFLIGGGNHPGKACINLVIDSQVVLTATGKNSDAMEWTSWDVRHLAGTKARLEIVDASSAGWGHIDIDQIELADRPRAEEVPLALRHDHGTMGFTLLRPGAGDRASASISTGEYSESVFGAEPADRRAFGTKLVGGLVRPMRLAPGAEASATFLIAWHFPNLSLPGTRLPARVGRHYAARFGSARDVAAYIAANFERLDRQTRLWHSTWYDSTLPRWFLDRTFANTSILATSTCHRFASGRFYAWEGVGCCAGTCTHVWHYAQAVARLFPDLERSLREEVDYREGVGFDSRTGSISHRGEEPVGPAVDGQAGCILRAYREHQMSADAAFLARLWPKVKKSLQWLIQHDANADGLLEGPQHNTLDAQWYGEVPWLSSLYLAALAAGGAMAHEMNDSEFADQCRLLRDRGAKSIVGELWNGELGYFIQRPDKAHSRAVGSYDGCEIDQVFGQHWAWAVALGRVLSEPHVKRALRSLWTYNFAPDVGPYRALNKPGRWFAMPGEAGLLMVTFPRGNRPGIDDPAGGWSSMYFNECMNGFEYQVAGHMIWEGMVLEGLAITRAVHDRYAASRRNPWNEVECGDHYARSMASYGVYLAACGFEYHGPNGHLGFVPRLGPDDFRAAFTSAAGWGTLAQTRADKSHHASIALRWGNLRLKSIRLGIKPGFEPVAARLRLGDRVWNVLIARNRDLVDFMLPEEVVLAAGQKLEIEIS
jgi:non-lysosomal glucosylceramidase